MKSNTPLVSVIIPIYNVEKYLEECLDSVVNQTYKNLEIILVDDKSPDSSGKIADQYAKKDKRIKVIHKPRNEGLNMARATGFMQSNGEYITFVDSDDMIEANFILRSFKVLIRHEADYVRFNFSEFNDSADLRQNLNKDKPLLKKVIKDKKDLYRIQFSGVPSGFSIAMCVWGALYSRRIIEHIDWKDCNFRAFEDNIWTLRLLESTNKAVYINTIGYLYRKDNQQGNALSQSVTGNFKNDKPIGYLEFLDILVKEFMHYNKLYDLNSEKEIIYFAATHFNQRIKRLVDNKCLDKENNLEYIPVALGYIERHSEMLATENESLKRESLILKNRDAAFLGVKNSGVLFITNLKRKTYSYLSPRTKEGKSRSS